MSIEPKTKYVKIVSLRMVREGSVKYSPIARKTDIENICKSILDETHCERVIVIGLDNSNRPNVIKSWEGAVNQCAAYPQEVFKILLLANCTSFVIAHNHPGGSRNPSEQDWQLTERLQEIGKAMDLQLMDHVLFAEEEIVSLRELSRWKN